MVHDADDGIYGDHVAANRKLTPSQSFASQSSSRLSLKPFFDDIMAMPDVAMERLLPMGADVKSLRREAKRRYDVATPLDVKSENCESPPKKSMSEKAKTVKATKTSASSNAKKKALVRHQQVAELQGVVDGIQQQVDAASKGIQELQQLVHMHLMDHVTTDEWSEPMTNTDVVTCVSPPASLMALEQDEEDEMELSGYSHEPLAYYGGDPLPFTC